MFSACSNDEPTLTQCVQFNLSDVEVIADGDITPAMTRRKSATLEEASVKTLFVYVDGELKRTLTPSDEDFTAPRLTLTYGQRSISFVATAQTASEYGTDVVRDAFGAVKAITVDGRTPSQSVTLSRIVSRLRLVVNDAIPHGLTSIEVVWPKRVLSVGASLYGAAGGSASAISVPASYEGRTGVGLSFYTFCPGHDEWLQTFTVRFKAGDEVIEEREVEAPLLQNRMTIISGEWLSANRTNALTIDDGWLTDYVVEI